VNASFSGSVTTDFVVDRVQSGAITSNQNVAINTKGAASVVFNVTGTWTGTLVFEALMPDTANWVPVFCYAKFPSGAAVSQTTGNGQWALPVGAINQFRVRGNTVSSGTATVNTEAGAGGLIFEVAQLTASNLNVTAVQGTAASNANAWTVKVTDGSNILGTSANPFVTQDKAEGSANGSTAVPTNALFVGAKGTDGFLHGLKSSTNDGAIDVNASVSGTFTPALTSDHTGNGTINAVSQNVTLNSGGLNTAGSQGAGTVIFNITGTWNGTLQFEALMPDASSWVPAKCLARYPTGTLASSLTQNGSTATQWSIATGGLANVRVRSSAWISGTATISFEAGAGVQDAQTLSLITDATNIAAVKAASTSPVAADPALVVAISPNSTQFATSTTANALPGVNPVSVGTSSVAILNSNSSRKEVIVVNTGTTVIYLGFGQTPSTTAYHVALAKCTSANDGSGGSWTSDMWKGAINAIGSAGGGTVCVTELI
jgi:hypothetical protein